MINFFLVLAPFNIMVDENTTTTRLLTLLNVSATKAGKKEWEPYVPAVKLNKRKSVRVAEGENPTMEDTPQDVQMGDGDQGQEIVSAKEEMDIEGVCYNCSEYDFT